MKEFGSNFHYLQIEANVAEVLGHYYPDAAYYAIGRHALIDLYRQMGWKRLWVPEYFCYEVLGSMQREGVNVVFYTDFPTSNEEKELQGLPFEKGDALLRVNYFGLRAKRSNSAIPVPVVEDHTHDLIGNWAQNSDADWCIASLRKTLPLAEGGILWSPRGNRLPKASRESSQNAKLAALMWDAMRKKSLYLENRIQDKAGFRDVMTTVEEQFDQLEISALDSETSDYIKFFDIQKWYSRKRENRLVLKSLQKDDFKILEPETEDCNPFSLTLLFSDEEDRDRYRKRLIENDVYPAILWNIPSGKHPDVVRFSKRMLSIHCDARYSLDDVSKLRSIMNGC